jgi:HK97 family phage prohead protease
MNTKLENRFLPIQELRVSTNADGTRVMKGYAAVFNSPSVDMGGWKEVIAPGAFTRSLGTKPDIMCTVEHDPKKGVLGRTSANTLRLEQDSKGLAFEVDLPKTTLANDIAESVMRKDITGCSFQMVVKDCNWDKNGDGVLRTVKDVDLRDVTITSQPAYPSTSVALRSLLFPDGAPEIPEFRSEAKTKKVDDEELSKDDFLIVGDPDKLETWKLPWHFSTAEKIKSHLRNALARFGQLKDVSEDVKKAAWSKLVRLCKEHDIDVQANRSVTDGNPNQSQPGTGCLCDCDPCWGGQCEMCSNEDCIESECRCYYSNTRSTNRLLAKIIETRLKWPD